MSKRDKHLEEGLDRLAALGDPVRRALYFHLLERGEVSRSHAARALRISRALAAFHLDKLAEAGLADVSYRRLSGRTGPGAGRPSKLYRKSSQPIELTLPARRYELAARLLACAATRSGPVATRALARAAEAWGRDLGREARARAGARAGATRRFACAIEALRAAGYEPRRKSRDTFYLGNCPFDALRSDARSLICSMNLSLCRGMAGELDLPSRTIRFEPQPDGCCVTLRTG